MKAAIERHLAMFHQNHTPGFLPCHNGTTNNPQTCWRRKGTGTPPPHQRRQHTPEPTPEPTPQPMQPVSGSPPASTGDTPSAQCLEIINWPAEYAYSHTSLPCAESFTRDTSAQDSEHDTDFDPDMLPDEGTSTG